MGTIFSQEMLIFIVISLVVLAVIRELFCWYSKINERLKIDKLILETLLKMYEKDGGKVDWSAFNSVLYNKSSKTNKS